MIHLISRKTSEPVLSLTTGSPAPLELFAEIIKWNSFCRALPLLCTSGVGTGFQEVRDLLQGFDLLQGELPKGAATALEERESSFSGIVLIVNFWTICSDDNHHVLVTQMIVDQLQKYLNWACSWTDLLRSADQSFQNSSVSSSCWWCSWLFKKLNLRSWQAALQTFESQEIQLKLRSSSERHRSTRSCRRTKWSRWRIWSAAGFWTRTHRFSMREPWTWHFTVRDFCKHVGSIFWSSAALQKIWTALTWSWGRSTSRCATFYVGAAANFCRAAEPLETRWWWCGRSTLRSARRLPLTNRAQILNEKFNK